jgi:hypothetical protein
MEIPGEVLNLYRSGVDVDTAAHMLPQYMRRNIRRWYRWLREGAPLKMADYRTIARQCGLVVIETPRANRFGKPVVSERLGEYALPYRDPFRIRQSKDAS